MGCWWYPRCYPPLQSGARAAGGAQRFTLWGGSGGSYVVILAEAPIAVRGAGGTAHPAASRGVVLGEAPGRCCKVLPNERLINVGVLWFYLLVVACFSPYSPSVASICLRGLWSHLFWGYGEVRGSSSACTRWQQPSSPRSDCAAQPPWPPAPVAASSTACVTFWGARGSLLAFSPLPKGR